ncbi:MAG: hypothetical protein ABIA21_01570 [Candidatus Aenigmatarchaeota archaeon]
MFNDSLFETNCRCESMDDYQFHLLMDVLKILEKYENDGTKNSIVDIIDTFDNRLSLEQKASVLKGFLEFKKLSESKKKRFQEHVERQEFNEFLHRDDFF